MDIHKPELIKRIIEFVKNELQGAEAGHDWFHIERVWKLSKKIAQTEEAELFIVELGALLHDIADSKFHGGNEDLGPQKAMAFLETIGVEERIIHQVIKIIKHISFKGGNFETGFQSSELSVVQDADRLDAIGAIGIARAFHFGGFKNRLLYDPSVEPDLEMDKESYKKSSAPTINHFYEKLLLLKDRMNTETGRKLALQRHAFMVDFLERFYSEWNGEQ